MSVELNSIVVVGASLAGLRAAETLRNEGFTGTLTVIGGEPHRPYDRPPLSKKVLAGEWDHDRIHLRSPEVFDEIDADWRFARRVASVDPESSTLTLDDGESLSFDGLIIATGASARRLPEQPDGVHELRTVDDALALRDELASGDRRVVVIGAGFIGLEVAATARQLGNEVLVLEGAEAPLIRGCGAEMGAAIGELHRGEGVDIRCGVSVESVAPDGVVLSGGERIDADVVVVGIGVAPETAWLADSGLEVRDGVVCDSTLRVVGEDGTVFDHIFGAGDVARWTNPLYGEEMRVEHWTNAAEQGALAAQNLLAGPGAMTEYAPVPFVWSDQFSYRIQFLGRSSPDDDVAVVAGAVEDGKFLALYGRDGVLHGALGVSAPRWVMPMRGALAERMSWDEAVQFGTELGQ